MGLLFQLAECKRLRRASHGATRAGTEEEEEEQDTLRNTDEEEPLDSGSEKAGAGIAMRHRLTFKGALDRAHLRTTFGSM
jgi:hypothetical protein